MSVRVGILLEQQSLDSALAVGDRDPLELILRHRWPDLSVLYGGSIGFGWQGNQMGPSCAFSGFEPLDGPCCHIHLLLRQWSGANGSDPSIDVASETNQNPIDGDG